MKIACIQLSSTQNYIRNINDIINYVNQAIKNKSDLIIFFAGHGLASSDGKELYLLPQDGNPDRLERTALSRTDLFKIYLNSIREKSFFIRGSI